VQIILPFNPYWDYTSEQCMAGINEIRERWIVGAKMAAHAGTGSATHYEKGEDKETLYWLAKRWFELHPDEIDLTAAGQTVHAFVIEHVGYR
jgi:hypothetical protein